MKILDRYILTTFLVSLVICLAAMMGLALLLDFSFNRNKFLDLAAETEEAGLWGLFAGIADYYVYRASCWRPRRCWCRRRRAWCA